MGKASKLKKIRKLASQLPVINTYAVIGERVSGKELMGMDNDGGGKAIDPMLTYKRKKQIQVPLNHNKKMKQAYNKHGIQGAAAYANAVVNYAKQHTS